MVPNMMTNVGNVSRATQSTTIAIHTDALKRRPKGRKAKPAKQAQKHITTTVHAGIGDRDVTSVGDGDAAKEFLVEELRQTIKTIKAKTTLVKLHSCAREKSAPSTSATVGGAASAAAPTGTGAAAAQSSSLNHLRAL